VTEEVVEVGRLEPSRPVEVDRSRAGEAIEQGLAPGHCEAPQRTVRFDWGMVLYLAMVVGLIEGRVVSAGEIVDLLCRVMRQHSIARRRRLDYAVGYLNKNPP
jgi:hypothetical protein